MIQRQRSVHRILIAVISLALVILFIAAIGYRHPRPVNPALPGDLLQPAGEKR